MLQNYGLRGQYENELPLLQKNFEIFSGLIASYMPQLSQHFETVGISPLFYSSDWFSTLFSYTFDFNLTVKIWDIFFLEGFQYIFNIALAILKVSEEDLLKLKFEDIILYLSSFVTTGTIC